MDINPKYRIGIPEMDAQHARWIHLIEVFRAAAENHLRDASGVAAARQALHALLEYTHSHFGSEEALLREYNYPELDDHCVMHDKLTTEIEKLFNELDTRKAAIAPLKLNLLVTVWLFEHIMEHDKAYANFLRQHVPRFAPKSP